MYLIISSDWDWEYSAQNEITEPVTHITRSCDQKQLLGLQKNKTEKTNCNIM